MEANQQPNNSNATPGQVGVSFLFAIALLAYGVRMWTRIHPTFNLAPADYIISAALLCELIVLICLQTAIHFGFGRYDYYISPSTLIKIMKCFFPLGIFGFWASSLARISIGTMLLRFEISNTRRVVLWILIFVQLAMAIGADIFQLLQCRPIRAMWEPVPSAICWTPRQSRSYNNIYAAMGIISDLVFATMPTFFIWSLPRPVMERILLTILMALGTIAAVAGGMKLYYIKLWNPRENSLRASMPLFWWYRVEEIGLIAAACAPFLKPPIERILGRFGASPFRFVTIGLNTIRSGQEDTAMDATKTGSSMQRTNGEQQLTQQTSGQAVSMVSSGSFCHSSDGAKYPREKDCVEV